MPAQRILPIYLAIIALLVVGLWKFYPLRQLQADGRDGLRPVFLTPFEAAFAGEKGYELAMMVNVGTAIAVFGQRQNEEVHALPGDDSIRYVERYGPAFRRIRNAEFDFELGSFGYPGTVSIRRDLARHPLALLEGGGTWTGCTVIWTTLVELAPDKPRLLLEALPTFEEDASEWNYNHKEERGWQMRASLKRVGNIILARYTGDMPAKKIIFERKGNALQPHSDVPDTCAS